MSTTKQFGSENWLSDIILLALGLAAFYFLWLGTYPLFIPDEARYSEVAREMITTGDYITPRVNGVAFLDKPILYYWLQACAIHLFGLNEWALRFFPALLGIIGCIITYISARILYDRRTALIASIILATSPLYFGGMHYADLNGEVAALISCSLLLFITAIKLHDEKVTRLPFRYFLYAAYVVASFAFLTKGLIALAFPVMIIGSWILILQRFTLLKSMAILHGLIIFVTITLPWCVLVEKHNPGFIHYFFITQQVTRFLSADVFNNKSPFWFYIPIILLGFFPWTIFLFQTIANNIRAIISNRKQYQIELFLLIWILIIFCFFSIPNSKTIGYILPIFPACALLVGNYIRKLWDKNSQNQFQHQSIIYCTILFTLTCFIITALILGLPYLKLVRYSQAFLPYLKGIAAIYLVSGITAICLLKQNRMLPLFLLCTLSNIIFLLTLTHSAEYLNIYSIKPLVMQIKPLLKPDDEVVNFKQFYQDTPIYLERRITIVADWQKETILKRDNWQREFWYGLPFQNTNAWLISEETFWQRWNESKRIYVFLHVRDLHDFQTKAKSYHFINKENNTVLVSNETK